MREYLVTGAAGFLGSNLVNRLLEDGDEVFGLDNLSTGRIQNLGCALDNPGFKWRKADLTKVGSLPRVDRIFHLASAASPHAYQRDPIGTLRVNAEGTFRVLESARKCDTRTLIASTSEVYGDPQVHPQSESYWGSVNPVGIRSCYDEGKRYSEALSMAYRRRYGLDIRIARIFNTYGPLMDPNDGRVISNFVVQGLKGKPFTIYGGGNQTRSFCYVSDLIEGLKRLMNAPARIPTPINLGNPREITIRKAAEVVASALEVPLKTRDLPLPADDPRQRCPDISAAVRYLGWQPRVAFEIGVAETVRYFRTSLKSQGRPPR